MADIARQSDENEREVARLWRAWRTIHQMVRDRGYELAQEEIDISLEDFQREYTDEQGVPLRNKMHFSARPSAEMIAKYTIPPNVKVRDPPPPAGNIWVEFFGDNSVGVKQMRLFAHTVSHNHFQTGIMVTMSSITAVALKIIPSVAPVVLETFLESDLLVNITHHELVPRHILLSLEEKLQLLERYRLKDSQLPRIQCGDPVARYLGLRRGQVVKIIRKSETSGRYASYRLAI